MRRASRVSTGFAVGGLVAFLSYELVRLLLVYAGDAAPRLTERWSPAIAVGGGIASALLELAVVLFIARSESGPSLLRRIGISAGAFGIAVAFGGMVLILMPMRPPVQPGRMPAGDVGGPAVALLVALAGGVVAAVGVLLVVFSVSWSWLRRGPGRG